MSLRKKLFSELNILYADQESSERDKLLSLLERFFNRVYLAESGEEAFTLFSAKGPDLIVANITLRGPGGLETAEAIRRYDLQTPIIILADNSDKSNLIKAIKAGVNDYLITPLDFDALLTALTRCAKRLSRFSSREHVFCDGSIYSFSKKAILSPAGETLHLLTRHESDLLELLICKRGEVVSYEEIEEYAYHGDHMSSDARKTLIKKLRKKVPCGSIKNLIAIGYLLS